jgi:hypothetical protein
MFFFVCYLHRFIAQDLGFMRLRDQGATHEMEQEFLEANVRVRPCVYLWVSLCVACISVH